MPIATVYEHVNYGGKSFDLNEGEYDINDIKLPNDCISSLKVEKGYYISLYEHMKFGGKCKTFCDDTPWVGDDFNDITSSIKVSKIKGTVIFEHAYYGGRLQNLSVGDYDLPEITIGNDTLSSIIVNEGYKVTLFEHAQFKGDTRIYEISTPWIGADFNDKTSSVKVEAVCCTIFEDKHYKGNFQSLGVGEYNVSDLKLKNKTVSSIKLKPSYNAYLMKSQSGQDKHKILIEQSTEDLAEFDNKTHSIEVFKK